MMASQNQRKLRIVEIPKDNDLMLHEAATIDYKYEVIRKLIHLNSLSIPIIYYHIDKQLALTILIPLTFAFLVVDIVRYYNPQVADWFYKFFGFLLRNKEKDEKRND